MRAAAAASAGVTEEGLACMVCAVRKAACFSAHVVPAGCGGGVDWAGVLWGGVVVWELVLTLVLLFIRAKRD